MQADLENLQMTKEELETLVDLDPSTALAIDAYRGFILKNPKQMLSVLLTELFILMLVLIFVMPVSLILLRNAGSLPGNTDGVTRLLIIISSISLLGVLIWNAYFWQQVKQVKSLARLIDKVDKYNRVIQAIALIDELESASRSPSRCNSLSTRREVIQALRITKETLSGALQAEMLMKKHRKFLSNHYELFANLEANLTSLLSFSLSDRVDEYSCLLNESLQIGISVHKELKN
ncbi:hypothetical protein NDI49_15245 [Trichocoleus sp. ST-U3]|uniref:hypothetical protein n=1 Tax=Coleofasciculus sp. FACHB-542 TaxID=2692787 RepID=UPI00199492FE|nr:hypothetical protein [Coleofasciculus sp. FACHB-542]MBD2085558.1 hypothetical protein [Coleofasciculus sp. FACHB-542]